MKRRLQFLALLMIAAATPAAAAPAGKEGRRVELVPWIGVRGGAKLDAKTSPAPPAEASPAGSLGFGVLVPVRGEGGWFEVYLDHQQLSFPGFDLAVDYLQFGGTYQPGDGRVRPFVAAGLGLTRYGASPGEVDNTVGLSGSIGGGFSVPMGARLAFRFEARGYATINDAAISVTCGPGCFVQFGADGWYQLAARVGLAIRM